MKSIYLFLIFCLVVSVSGCLTTKTTDMMDDLSPILVPPEKVANYDRDVVWASPGGRDIKLDVSWPAGEGPFPVLVWVHGGGWEYFSKEGNEGMARYITNRGYVVVNANYRMAKEVTMKTMVEDAFGIVIWTKDNIEKYNGDPNRVAVSGHSAGGHLESMVTVACGDPYFTPTYKSEKGNDCTVKASIPVSGIYDFTERGEEKVDWTTKIFGVSYKEDPELYEKCSPISYVKADLPPQLIVYAEKEGLRPAAEDWVNRMKETGAPVESYMEPGVNHAWPSFHWRKPAQNTYDRMIKFLDENL
jgi:acetyl esterase/lipase